MKRQLTNDDVGKWAKVNSKVRYVGGMSLKIVSIGSEGNNALCEKASGGRHRLGASEIVSITEEKRQ